MRLICFVPRARRHVQIAVEDDVGFGAQAAVVEVHEQESRVEQHVDVGDGRAEFDGVEQGWPAVDEHDVAQVQIAVAVAHPALPAAVFEQRGDAGQFAPAGFDQACDVGGNEGAGGGFGEAGGIVVDILGHGWAAAEAGSDVAGGVETGDDGGGVFQDGGGQPALPGQAVEQQAVVEAVHVDQPIDVFARPAQGQGAIGLAGDGDHAAIEIRRRAPVDGDFRQAGLAAALGRREIEIRETHGALQLQRPVAINEQFGDVGGDAADGSDVRKLI